MRKQPPPHNAIIRDVRVLRLLGTTGELPRTGREGPADEPPVCGGVRVRFILVFHCFSLFFIVFHLVSIGCPLKSGECRRLLRHSGDFSYNARRAASQIQLVWANDVLPDWCGKEKPADLMFTEGGTGAVSDSAEGPAPFENERDGRVICYGCAAAEDAVRFTLTFHWFSLVFQLGFCSVGLPLKSERNFRFRCWWEMFFVARVSKYDEFVLKTRSYVSKTRNCVFKMMNLNHRTCPATVHGTTGCLRSA